MARVRSCAAVAFALASVLLFTAAELNAPGTTGVLQASIGGKRTLVLADGPQIQDSHSMFFSALEVGAEPSGFSTVSVSFDCGT